MTLAIGKTTTKNATDKRTNVKLNIAKQDAETGNAAQGDATLEGAVYGLYAREDMFIRMEEPERSIRKTANHIPDNG